jgi:hypothetical protein
VTTYEVQGRRTERDPSGKVHDVVRLDSAPNRESAFAIAEAMRAERLTVWVFAAERRAGRPTYRLVRVLSHGGP